LRGRRISSPAGRTMSTSSSCASFTSACATSRRKPDRPRALAMSELALRIAVRCGLAAAALAMVLADLVPPVFAAQGSDAGQVVLLADLPPEARQTVALIRRGGPFPY